MHCPKCTGQELVSETIEGVEIDRCPQCNGIWLDALELERLLEAHPKSLLGEDRVFAKADSGTSGAQLKCPRCEGATLIKLNSRLSPGTILDSCTVCYGNWLDAGELSRLSGSNIGSRLRRLFLG